LRRRRSDCIFCVIVGSEIGSDVIWLWFGAFAIGSSVAEALGLGLSIKILMTIGRYLPLPTCTQMTKC
jgi:hypothetical protein